MENNNTAVRILSVVKQRHPMLTTVMSGMLVGREQLTSHQVRYDLNCSLRDYLNSLPVETMDVRVFLDDYDNYEYWYNNLITKVLPFMESNHNIK